MRIQAAPALFGALLLATACADLHDPVAPVAGAPASLITPGDLVVNTLDDVRDADGCTSAHCSLREAVLAATDGERITFSVTGTIQLQSPGMPLDHSIVIVGPGAAQLTIAAAAIAMNHGHFLVRPDADVTMSGMRLTGGVATVGGSIANQGTLALDAMEIAHNSSDFGGGIFNRGTLSVVRSTIRDNVAGRTGGGIYSEGALAIDDTDIIANRVESGLPSGGGGVRNNDGSLVVRDSRFDDNVAFGGIAQGGALENSGETATAFVVGTRFTGNAADGGGAIFNDRAMLEIRESVIDGNLARNGRGGAIIVQEGSLDAANTLIRFNTSAAQDFAPLRTSIVFGYDAAITLRHVAIHTNGMQHNDGQWSAAVLSTGANGSLRLLNSIVAGNVNGADQFDVAAVPDAADIRGNLLGLPYPLLTGLAAENTVHTPITPGNWETSFGLASASPVDGMARYTVLPGSHVIDRGVADGCVALDLAGTARPQGAACDAGAIEFIPIADVEVPVASALTGALDPAAAGSSVSLGALVDDAATGGSAIAGAEASLDGFDTMVPLDALDGSFDSPSEHVRGSFTVPADAGIYDVCVRGTDAAGNTGSPVCTALVVYNPAAGFVTGGGWIKSPAGASATDPSFDGKATFSFVARYRDGAAVPEGQTRFAFQGGGFSFEADTLDWLIISGDAFQLMGSGSIRGMTGRFRFLLRGTDGASDRLRMRITDAAGTVVYDNGTEQSLGGGSIVVHDR